MENNYVSTCCSTADMPKEYLDKRNIPYVCFHFVIDGKSYPDDLGETVKISDFYKMIADGAMPTTSQVNTDEFMQFFEPYLKDGKDIIHLSLSTGISGVYNSARIAADELSAKYPERNITVIDTLCASAGFGLIIDMAADRRDSGMGYDELCKWIEDNKKPFITGSLQPTSFISKEAAESPQRRLLPELFSGYVRLCTLIMRASSPPLKRFAPKRKLSKESLSV